MLYIPSPFKRCVKCMSLYLVTENAFPPHKKTRDGLSTWCRRCHNERTRRWKQANSDAIHDYNQCYREENAEAIKEQERHYRQQNADVVHDRERRWRHNNPEKKRASRRRWYYANPDKVKEQKRRQYLANREADNARSSHYAKMHPREVYQRTKGYRKRHPEKVKAIYHSRRARRRGLPSTFTATDWERCLAYWNHRCAYCDRPIGLWHTLAQDHFVPESKGGPYTPDNILPACHSRHGGEMGCNNTKSNRELAEWLTERFGPRKAKQILKRIAEYFEWVKGQS